MRLIRMAVLGALVGTSACLSYSGEGPERPAPKLRKIQDAKILKMQPHLFQQKGLCPGMEGKLYANANVQWGASKPVPRNIGQAGDSLQSADFLVTGPLVKGDEKAHLFPDPDILKSVESGFEAKVVYKPDPTKFTWNAVFPPDYSCYAGWFADGGVGNGGNNGNDGGNNGEGTNGTNGGQGGNGDIGPSGGRIVAVVTVVATRWYPRLFAVIANNTLFLAPADRDIVFGAAGGQGGSGGNGGNGGQGGDQHTETTEVPDKNASDGKRTVWVGKGPAGNGGNGGNGGRGGNGGKGGSIEVTFDSAFPELQRYIKVDVSGGAPGYAGAGGGYGTGGTTNAEQNAQRGKDGSGGLNGNDGLQGSNGTARVGAGSVSAKFGNLKGIAIYGSTQAKALASNPPPPMLPDIDQALINSIQGKPVPTAPPPVIAPPASSGKNPVAPPAASSGRAPGARPAPFPTRPTR